MTGKNWLVIDTSAADGMRFSEVSPSDRPTLGLVTTVDAKGLPTFTDALQAFARHSGKKLTDFEPLLCIAGAASGDMISLARSNWTITRAGLSALFDSRVRIINDVVAMAWGVSGGGARVASLKGARTAPDFAAPGRMAMLYVGGGVGAAIVDVDRDKRLRIMETESGHLDFSPASERELKLAEAVRGEHHFTSWEDMLKVDARHAAWDQFPEMREIERDRMMGDLFGRYLANLIHAHGAWNGVMLTGPRVGALTGGSAKIPFDGAFTRRRPFQRLLMQAPVWTVDQHEAVLTGGAALMAKRSAEERGALLAA